MHKYELKTSPGLMHKYELNMDKNGNGNMEWPTL